MKKKKSFVFRKLTIGAQLSVLVCAIVILAFGCIIYTTYTRQVRSFVKEYRESSQTILTMESSNLDQYIKELRSFCVRPCLNVSVYNSLLKMNSLTSEEQNAIRQEIQTEYHSRTDLRSYAITAIGAGLRFERPVGGQHVQVYSSGDIKNSAPYLACGNSSKYEYLSPSGEDGTFFRYYHYMIRLQNRSPISLSYIDLDDTQLRLLLANHTQPGEAICIYNTQGELLYTNWNSTSTENDSASTVVSPSNYELFASRNTITLGKESYLLSHCQSEETGLLMVSLLPKSVLTSRARSLMNPMLVIAILIMLLLIAVIFTVLHLLTEPLSRLSAQMGRMAQGDFSELTLSENCKETAELTASYNSMVLRLNDLIEKNYIANLHEKNAQLKTLEAQLNPHFLYNTLQAIATEALLSENMEVYDMIVSLASNLRYTIKGDKLVPLSSEMTYVHNYILLQKKRLGNRLLVEEEIDPESISLVIPKISIQILVENAIIHGMPSNQAPLHLRIRTTLKEELLCVTVFDDGVGISDDQMQTLNQQLHAEALTEEGAEESIGLRNLARRLQIMYPNQASLQVESVSGSYTSVIMQIQISDNASVSAKDTCTKGS